MPVDKLPQGSASLYFAGDNFVENQPLSVSHFDQLAQQGVLVEKTIPIDRYFRAEMNGFNFKDNGFEFVTFNQKIVEDLGAFADMPNFDDHGPLEKDIRKQFRLFLTDWGKKQGIAFDIVIPLSDLVYRHTADDRHHRYKEIDIPAQKPLKMAHTDFCEKDFSGFLSTYDYMLEWQLEEDSISLSDLELSEIVNLWAPLNERPTLNTLAVMDISTIGDPSEELKPMLDDPCLNSVKWTPDQRWFVQEDMQRGDGVVFRTFKTPHAGVSIEKAIECDDFRHSLEGRYLFCKRKEQKI